MRNSLGNARQGYRRPDLLELTCTRDGHSHLVALDAFAAAAQSQRGVFPAVCGHEVTAGSMSAPPGPLCRTCSSS